MDNSFLLGTDALGSQLEALKERKGKDAFVPGLREFQAQLQQVEVDIAALNDQREQARAFVILKPIARPRQPSGPKPMLALALSVVVGGVLGLCWILIAGLAQAVRERDTISAT